MFGLKVVNRYALVSVYAALMATSVHGAINSFDFGTGTGVHNTNSASTTFLPVPPSGTARVRVGTQGGSFTLANPGETFIGTDTELQCTGPTGGSANKFSIYDYAPDKSFHTRFRIYLTAAASGTWYFFQGDGASYSDNNVFSSTQIFSGIRWQLGTPLTLTTNVRSGASWVTTGLPATPFSQNVVYYVEIYGNNSTSPLNYSRSGSSYTVAANQWDLWINDTRTAGLAKGQLPNDAVVDSFMFYGESATANLATIILDDFSYGGDLGSVPVAVSSFSVD
jgi:hypothetical protein